MDISVIGTGYVGLVSGVCLAERGHHVICVDVDRRKVDQINHGIAPIYEKGLKELLTRNVGRNLSATTDLPSAVSQTQLSLIAVGTPYRGDKIDLTFIEEASRQIGGALRQKLQYHMVVVKSTVVPGTTDTVVLPILERTSGKKAGADFGVGMNPEFLREGEAVQDFMAPDRIVLGGIDRRSLEMLEQIYRPFEGVDILKTNAKTAEMIKYASNSLLATMISFANEMANLCTTIGEVDVKEVQKGLHLDKRLSPLLPDGERVTPAFTTYIEAGCGFGGSCFPKDVKALIAYGKQLGQPMQLLEAVIETNRRQPFRILSILQKHFASLTGVCVAILGLAFKPGTDDMRESPAIPVVRKLLSAGAKIRVYDPVAQDEARKVFSSGAIQYSASLSGAIEEADAVILLTRWPEFVKLPALLAAMDPQPLFVDGRRMFDKTQFSRYDGIGM